MSVASLPNMYPSSVSEVVQIIDDAKTKLGLYRKQHSGEYIGGVEYTDLQQRLSAVKDWVAALAEKNKAGSEPHRYHVQVHTPLIPGEPYWTVVLAKDYDYLRSALQELVDWQNGPPLSSRKWLDGWEDAMKKAKKLLGTEVQIP